MTSLDGNGGRSERMEIAPQRADYCSLLGRYMLLLGSLYSYSVLVVYQILRVKFAGWSATARVNHFVSVTNRIQHHLPDQINILARHMLYHIYHRAHDQMDFKPDQKVVKDCEDERPQLHQTPPPITVRISSSGVDLDPSKLCLSKQQRQSLESL